MLATTLIAFSPAVVPRGVLGHIADTVAEKVGDVTVPVRRRVYLMESLSKRVVQTVMSDRVTGAYRFDNLVVGDKFDVVSYDPAGNFRAVIADNLAAEATL